MKTTAAQKSKSFLPGWTGTVFALLLALLLIWGANPGHAAGEVTITHIHTDINGNPIAATDEDGNLVWKESYQPFGARTQYNPASAAQTQWFHGKEQDATSGLQYFGARWYDSEIGRFLGMDPVGFQDGKLHSFNRYAYGNNNPIRYLDPDGKSPDYILATDPAFFMSEIAPSLYNVDTSTQEGNDAVLGIMQQEAASEIVGWVIGGAVGQAVGASANGIGKLVFAKSGTAISNTAFKHGFKYAPRVQTRGVEDKLAHNFPYSFDDIILSAKPIIHKDGYRIFQHPGSISGKLSTNQITGIRMQKYKDGVFEIGVTKDGVINHRFFRPN